MRIQYRTRRIAEDLLLAPTAGQTLIKNRDGHPYLIDGPRTELVTRIHPPLPKPAGAWATASTMTPTGPTPHGRATGTD